MKHLTLIVPGLLWPAQSARAVAQDLNLPGLCALLFDAELRRKAPCSAEDVLLDSFGLSHNAARAQLRALGDGLETDHIICADPVPLVFGREGLVVGEPAALAITEDEAAALVASLNDNFADIGHFSAPHPERWYVRTHHTDWGTHPLHDAVGRRIDNYLPASSAARRLLNEIQMLFHAHPVNALREQRGQPAINSVWLWGEGSLPAAPAASSPLFADGAFAAGLARWAGVDCLRPARLDASLPDHAIVVLDHARQACVNHDIDHWREALETLDADWFAPAQASLSHCALKLVLPGDRLSLDAHCRKAPFWRLRARRHDIADFLSNLSD